MLDYSLRGDVLESKSVWSFFMDTYEKSISPREQGGVNRTNGQVWLSLMYWSRP